MNVKIKLSKPFTLYNKRVDEIEIKEPTGGAYAQLGEPRVLVHTNSGGGYLVEQPAVINAYLEKCLVNDLGGDVLNLMSLQDVMEIKDALLGFFTEAAAGLALKRSMQSSSALARRAEPNAVGSNSAKSSDSSNAPSHGESAPGEQGDSAAVTLAAYEKPDVLLRAPARPNL